MQKEEVKQSWSASYIILTIVLSIITGIIGYFIKNIFDRPERRVLTVTETQTENLLNLDQKVHDEIITSYTLRNTPSETIKSYFRYSATIHNDGDVGVEKLKVFVQVNGSDVILVKSPSITTVPPDIHQGITLQQNKKVTEVSKDEWEVSLLNHHESITFTYIGYSTKEVNNASFKLVPRKKDWEVVREGTKTHSESNSFFGKTITEMQGRDLFFLIMIFFCIQMALLIYLLLWVRLFLRRPGRLYFEILERLFWRLEELSQQRQNGSTDST